MTGSAFGQSGPTANNGPANAIDFHVQQALSQVRTIMTVKVVKVYGGGVGAPPTIDVQPLVKQTDGQGNTTDHGTIYGLAVLRGQGGGNAVINDPKVGDVGIIAVSDRDISALKANKGQKVSPPGSKRMHDPSDGIYLGAVMKPDQQAQYIQFGDGTVTIKDASGHTIVMGSGGITITSGAGINLNGVVIDSSGKITAPGDIIAGSVSLQNHVHTEVTSGAALSGPPQA